MNVRIAPLCVLSLVVLGGCFPPPLVDRICADGRPCETTGAEDTTGAAASTTGGGLEMETRAGSEDAGSMSAEADSGADSLDTHGETSEPPMIVEGVVTPDYIDENGVLAVEVLTANEVEGVHMRLHNGAVIELTANGVETFVGEIAAFSFDENGQHPAVLTPWRGPLTGASVSVNYVISLPQSGLASEWKVDGPGGRVAAIATLPDGRPVEFGTYEDMGSPRCYLHMRDKYGKSVAYIDLMAGLYCDAIDLKIDGESGQMRVLVEQMDGNEVVWWAGELPSWGREPNNLGVGVKGDTALALAARPDVVAVCGTRAVPTVDKLDALAVLLRDNEAPEVRTFDYMPKGTKHLFADSAHDCAFMGDTLVLVGEAEGAHDEGLLKVRDRLMVIEWDVTVAKDPAWTVAGIELGVQTRALALDLDEQGRYHLVGDKCNDACEPEGELWVYEPGGALVGHNSIGPLGTSWFGPHDIAWSPAGYDVVAFGAMRGSSSVFKVQAFAPGVPVPRWTFFPSEDQGLQLAFAVAVGPYGEVYAGGVAADDQLAFRRING